MVAVGATEPLLGGCWRSCLAHVSSDMTQPRSRQRLAHLDLHQGVVVYSDVCYLMPVVCKVTRVLGSLRSNNGG